LAKVEPCPLERKKGGKEKGGGEGKRPQVWRFRDQRGEKRDHTTTKQLMMKKDQKGRKEASPPRDEKWGM